MSQYKRAVGQRLKNIFFPPLQLHVLQVHIPILEFICYSTHIFNFAKWKPDKQSGFSHGYPIQYGGNLHLFLARVPPFSHPLTSY